MRPHVEPLPDEELARSHLVEENERADHLPFLGRQDAADLEAADIMGAGNDHGLNARGMRAVAESCSAGSSADLQANRTA